MGCGQSKSPRGERRARGAVAHCRDRCELLAGAMASRYELADAHRAYAASLTATGAALHDFLRTLQDAAPPPPEPGAGDAPGEEEGDGSGTDDVTVSPPVVSSLPPDASEDEDDDDDNDDDGGHILQSPSDEDEASDVGGGDDAEPSLPRPPEHLQPVPPAPPTPQAEAPQAPQQMVPSYVPGYPPPPPYSYGPTAYGYGSSYGGGYGYGGADMAGYYGHTVYNNYTSYARSHPPPPYIVHHHQVADATAGYYHDDDHQYHQGEAVQTPSPSQYGAYYYSYPYPCMHAGDDGGSSPVLAASAQLSAPRPTTPSPPRAPTTWAFLDPFEGIETYCCCQGQDHPAVAAAAAAAYAPNSQTSSDVSLVNEEKLPEVDDEEIHKVEDEGLPDLEDDESGVVGDDARRHAEGERTCSCKSSASEGDSDCNDPAEEGHIVEINTLDGVEGENDSVVEEQQHLSGTNTTAVAEPAAVSETTTYTDVEVGQELQAALGFEEEKAMERGNLSCSLEKLYMWEKKLLKEVKGVL
nr:unnamed protein product [Digitaria exilis]